MCASGPSRGLPIYFLFPLAVSFIRNLILLSKLFRTCQDGRIGQAYIFSDHSVLINSIWNRLQTAFNMSDQRLVEFLINLGIARSEASTVAEVTQLPEEALQLLGRRSDGTISLSRKEVEEWYSEEHQKFFYAIKGEPTTSWTPPACFAFSEWALDASVYHISVRTARDVYMTLDTLITGHPPQIAFPAVETLAKILGNISDCSNENPKYRCIRLSNEKFKKTVCEVPGAIDVLLLSGFQLLDDAVILPENAPLQILRATAARASSLATKKGHSGSAKSDGSSPPEATSSDSNTQPSAGTPPSPFYGTPGFLYQERIYHCSHCDHPINDGSERLWTGRHDAPLGEYRFECTTCVPPAPSFHLCQACWDRMQEEGEQGRNRIHPLGHTFHHVGPRMSRHNDYYGTHGQGGGGDGSNPWGNRGGLGGGYSRGLARMRERYGIRDLG